MKNLESIINDHNLLALSQEQLNRFKHQEDYCFGKAEAGIYKNSLYTKNSILYFIGRVKHRKALFLASIAPLNPEPAGEFTGKIESCAGFYIQTVDFTVNNAKVLQKIFPFTAPVPLRGKKTTIGCGDRLGLATPGQLQAVRQYDLYPVLAQQSTRELNFTGRTYSGVIADTAFLVFQEGFEKGYGADGDHLKTIADIGIALDAGATMITLDLSDVMRPDAVHWSAEKIQNEFAELPAGEKKRLLDTYAEKSFVVEDTTLFLSTQETLLCAVMYNNALDYSREADQFLKTRCADNYDLEISIDETTTPTLPAHHLFITRELHYRNVNVNSLAPRFTGEFQKAIDYIGDKEEFAKQFALHCKIARANGGYKISVHSGSDKFSVYPAIGLYSGLYLHLKTAGTSWLEAVRCIALAKPGLYRELHKMAFRYYEQARKFYHITADLSRIKALDKAADEELPAYLDADESRQLLHITYGGLLTHPGLGTDFFRVLAENEELHYTLLKKHFEKHIEKLGIPRLQKH